MKFHEIKFKWMSKVEYDAARILDTYLDVKRHFFQHHQFLVLPYASKWSVFLPELDYATYSDVRQEPFYRYKNAQKKAVKKIVEQLSHYSYPSTIIVDQIKKVFLPVQEELLQVLESIFPKQISEIGTINIITTRFGTEGSFDYVKTKSGYDLYIWIRTTGVSLTALVAQLIHCIVSGFILIHIKTPDTLSYEWKVREAIIDYLLEYTILNTIWKKINKTLPIIESAQNSKKKQEDSRKYLVKLKAVILPPLVSKKGKKIVIEGKLLPPLTLKEYRLFSFLYSQSNMFVTKDELIDAVYGEDEGSNWSLSKLVQRIRKKIESVGIYYPVIITSRKTGYRLNSQN